jgi:predicted membrane chloride channel (bestrophin family)
VPFTPVALIGTTVAFMIGFQNNAAYYGIWEARKLWGGITSDILRIMEDPQYIPDSFKNINNIYM